MFTTKRSYLKFHTCKSTSHLTFFPSVAVFASLAWVSVSWVSSSSRRRWSCSFSSAACERALITIWSDSLRKREASSRDNLTSSLSWSTWWDVWNIFLQNCYFGCHFSFSGTFSQYWLTSKAIASVWYESWWHPWAGFQPWSFGLQPFTTKHSL